MIVPTPSRLASVAPRWRRHNYFAAFFVALMFSAPAQAQNLSLRAPPWAQTMLASDVIPTTGGRAALAGEGIAVAARITIAPIDGGVARVIRYETNEDGALLALRRFTGHPTTGWWMWGPDTPRVSVPTPAVRTEIEALVRAAMSVVSGLNAAQSGDPCHGEQAFIELALEGRSTSATRACVTAGDPAGRLATRLSELAGSRDNEELAAAATAELLGADRAFAAMAQAEGVPESFAAYAASEAIMLRSEGAPTAGHDAVVARFADWPEAARLQWSPQTARVSSRGDMGWTWGDSVYIAADGTRTPGRYISVWSRDVDGNWRFAFDAGVD